MTRPASVESHVGKQGPGASTAEITDEGEVVMPAAPAAARAIQVRWVTVAVGLLLALGAVSMLYGGWLSDDYLVGLRQSLNLVHGRGFSYFSSARVQTMTSPLWGLALAPVVWLSDAFYAPLLMSVALSLAALVVLQRSFWSEKTAQVPLAVALSVLVASKAYIDFSTSGLENSLAHLLAALLFVAFAQFAPAPTSRGFSKVCAYAALLCLTRYDYAILVFPTLLWGTCRLAKRWQFSRGLAAFTGVCLPWFAFSLVYYGTIFPNAFYAKLTTAIPLRDSMAFGLECYRVAWQHDPTSLLGIGLGVLLASLGSKRRQWLPISAGVLLYMAYIIVVGGDFMTGRFISVPTLLGAGLLADGLRQMSSPRFWKGAVAGLAAFIVVIRPELPLLDNYSSKKSMRAAGKSHVLRHGIKDEKKAYVYDRGLMTGHERFAPWLASRVELWKEQPRPEARRAVLVRCGGLGWRSFEYGPEADVYDLCALTDPFLSKLPLYDVGANQQLSSWTPGHFIRTEPDGYGESVATQQNLLLDPVLRDVYAAVQEVTAGPLFDWQRWRAIARLASLDLIFAARGAPTYLGTKYPKKQDTRVASYAFYSSPFRTDCMAEEPAEVTRGDGRELVLLENTAHPPSIKLTGTMDTEFRVILTAQSSEVYRFVLTPTNNCRQGLGIAAERLPARVAERGFDAAIVEPVGIPDSSTVHFGGILFEGVDPGVISETEIRRLWAHDATAN